MSRGRCTFGCLLLLLGCAGDSDGSDAGSRASAGPATGAHHDLDASTADGAPPMFANADAQPPLLIYDGGDDTDAGCGRVQVATHRVVPRVHLLVDASNSMTTVIKDMFTRWDALGFALFDPDAGVVTRLEDVVAFGMTIYWDEYDMCPLTKQWAPALHQAQALHDGFTAIGSPPGFQTPTLEVIESSRPFVLDSEASVQAPPGPTLVVLATDGAPFGCTKLDVSSCSNLPEDQVLDCIAMMEDAYRVVVRDKTVKAARDNFNSELPTYVISLADEAPLSADLQRMANAGQGMAEDATPGAELFVPSDPDALRDMLLDIVGRGGSCQVALTGELDLSAACSGEVLLDGRALACDGADGWHALDNRHIELKGKACKQWLDSSESRLLASFPCAAVQLD